MPSLSSGVILNFVIGMILDESAEHIRGQFLFGSNCLERRWLTTQTTAPEELLPHEQVRTGTRSRRIMDIAATWLYTRGGKLSPLPTSRPTMQGTKYAMPRVSLSLTSNGNLFELALRLRVVWEFRFGLGLLPVGVRRQPRFDADRLGASTG